MKGVEIMKELFQYANDYLKTIDSKDMILIKLCLISLGIIIGINIPKKHRKYVLVIVVFIFIITYIPILTNLISSILGHKDNSYITL